MRRLLLIPILLFAAPALGQMQRIADGLEAHINDGILRLQVRNDNIIRVAFAHDEKFFDHASVMVVPNASNTSWNFASDNQSATIKTSRLSAKLDLSTGAVTFLDSTGKIILSEIPARIMEAADVQGEKTFHIQQQWQSDPGESLYGLGENQLGTLDIKNLDLDLWQHNGTIVIPFLLSTRGWGILWDNTSLTHFGDRRDFVPVPGIDTSATRPSRGRYVWDTQFNPATTGEYQFQAFSNGGIKATIDGQSVIDHWRQGWLPWFDQIHLPLTAGKTAAIHVEWNADQDPATFRFLYKSPAETPRNISLWSQVGDGIDYYFVYGSSLDKTIAGYRQITGAAPMPPIWAFGLWQSRQRYETSQQSLDVIAKFRDKKIPFDNIVQDWLWWREAEWGSQTFDPQRFPDPDGWIKTIHADHANLMISVWAKFYPGTDNFKAMQEHGFLFDSILKENLHDWRRHAYTFFDAFNPEADKLFWSQLDNAVFKKGVDAWWMDATEPDLLPDPTLEGTQTHMNPTAQGTGSRVLNSFPIMMSRTIYEGQRASDPDKRVFILTRSAFAGQQRYGASCWSGDISSTWTAMKRQIAAGLSFSISGIPYWTMDIGGFSVPQRFSSRNPTPENLDEWREMFTRWFEFGTFCPLLRVHGEFPNREMWEFGPDSGPAYQAQFKFDTLRYHLLPYIYSLAADVTRNGGTIMRPLAMDFPNDPASQNISTEYLFGPSFLVTPVTTYKARTQSVYLPAGSDWYDFWTNQKLTGGQTIESPAPYDAIPLHIRAGSIIPMGPDLQYTTEKPIDPITLKIYPGANGSLNLYEDEGINNNYEHGDFAIIPITWNDATKTLTIGKREGTFKGMLASRTFNIEFIPNKGGTKTIQYDGSAVEVL